MFTNFRDNVSRTNLTGEMTDVGAPSVDDQYEEVKEERKSEERSSDGFMPPTTTTHTYSVVEAET